MTEIKQGEINEEMRAKKLGLLTEFLVEVKAGRMSEQEFVDRLETVVFNRYITDQDEGKLRHELAVILNRTPEQIRENKLGFLRQFIKLVGAGQMDREEFDMLFFSVIKHGYITETDIQAIDQELKLELGETPPQIRERAVGLIRGFIKLVATGLMSVDEVQDRIAQVVGNKSITGEDGVMLYHELLSVDSQSAE